MLLHAATSHSHCSHSLLGLAPVCVDQRNTRELVRHCVSSGKVCVCGCALLASLLVVVIKVREAYSELLYARLRMPR